MCCRSIACYFVPMTSVRRATLVGGVVFLIIGLLRGVIQIALYAHAPQAAMMRIGITVSIALFWVPVTTLVALLVRRQLERRRALWLLFALGLALTALYPCWVLVVNTVMTSGRASSYLALLVSGSDTSALFYLAIVGVSWAANDWSRQEAQRRNAALLDTALADAQLHILTLQLHPHFLFNTLNLVSQLAFEDAGEAQRTICHLRSLLVESLRHAAQPEVKLGDELRFLRAYLEIQQSRFRSRLRVEWDIDPRVPEAAIPHLLLQPLVENAIAHGIAPLPNGGTVYIGAQRAGDRLVVRIGNSGGALVFPVSERMGLTNTRLRLTQLFGPDHRIDLSARPESGAIATVNIPFRPLGMTERAASEEMDSQFHAASATDPAPSRKAPLWLQVVMCWTGIAVLWTELDATTQIALGSGVTWSASAISSAVNAVMWLGITPLAIWFARRLDLSSGLTVRRLAEHLGAAIAIAILHVVAWLSFLAAFVPSAFRAQYGNRFAWGVWDVAAYLTIVAFVLIVRIASRRRETQLVIAETQARLVATRLASMRLHLQPGVLLASLDAIATLVGRDPVRAERAITRLGDLLRCLVATGEQSMVDLAEEVETLRAFVDVTTAASASHRCEVEIPYGDQIPDVSVPAMVLAPAAAAIGGTMRHVELGARDGAIRLCITSEDAVIDERALAQLRARLEAISRDSQLHVGRKANLTTVELLLPVHQEAEAQSLPSRAAGERWSAIA